MREIKFREKSKNGVDYFIIQNYKIKDLKIELGTCASPQILGTILGQYTGLKNKSTGKVEWRAEPNKEYYILEILEEEE